MRGGGSGNGIAPLGLSCMFKPDALIKHEGGINLNAISSPQLGPSVWAHWRVGMRGSMVVNVRLCATP